MGRHFETRYQDRYIAKLREDGDTCEEIVFLDGEQIHRTTFPTRNLGGASRGEYLQCMVSSVAYQHEHPEIFSK